MSKPHLGQQYSVRYNEKKGRQNLKDETRTSCLVTAATENAETVAKVTGEEAGITGEQMQNVLSTESIAWN